MRKVQCTAKCYFLEPSQWNEIPCLEIQINVHRLFLVHEPARAFEGVSLYSVAIPYSTP